MNKAIGILGYRGAVGQSVLNYLKYKYPIKCGQRTEDGKKNDGNIQYAKVDILNRRELEEFCEGCRVIVNCAGPSYYLSKKVAEVSLEKNINYVDVFGVNVFKTIRETAKNSIILGAGSFPGLSGMLPSWIAKQRDGNIEKINIFAGGNEEITTAACVDYLLSIFNAFGKSNIYYYENKVSKCSNKKVKVPNIFPSYAKAFEYLTEEMKLSANLNKVRELHWYNVQMQSLYKETINNAFIELLKNPEKSNVFKAAEKVRREMISSNKDSEKWYKIWAEVRRNSFSEVYGFECENSSIINGKIAAMCAEKLYDCSNKPGVYWAFQILEGEKVIETLLSKGILNKVQIQDDNILNEELDYEEGEI